MRISRNKFYLDTDPRDYPKISVQIAASDAEDAPWRADSTVYELFTIVFTSPVAFKDLRAETNPAGKLVRYFDFEFLVRSDGASLEVDVEAFGEKMASRNISITFSKTTRPSKDKDRETKSLAQQSERPALPTGRDSASGKSYEVPSVRTARHEPASSRRGHRGPSISEPTSNPRRFDKALPDNSRTNPRQRSATSQSRPSTPPDRPRVAGSFRDALRRNFSIRTSTAEERLERDASGSRSESKRDSSRKSGRENGLRASPSIWHLPSLITSRQDEDSSDQRRHRRKSDSSESRRPPRRKTRRSSLHPPSELDEE